MRQILQTFSVFFMMMISLCTSAQKRIQLKSPDGNIIFSFKLTTEAPEYQVEYKGQTLIDYSTLGLSFEKSGDFGKDLKMNKPIFRKGEDNYTLIVGKTKNVHDQYQEVTISLQEQN